jgi:hypothetical protein
MAVHHSFWIESKCSTVEVSRHCKAGPRSEPEQASLENERSASPNEGWIRFLFLLDRYF